MAVEPGKIGGPRNGGARRVAITLGRPVGNAKREGGVRIGGGAELGEADPRHLGGRFGNGCLQAVFLALAQRARLGFEGAHQAQHSVARPRRGRRIRAQPLALGGVRKLARRDVSRRGGSGGPPIQHRADDGVARAELPLERSEVAGQHGHFLRRGDGRIAEQRLLHRRQRRVHILAQPVRIRLAFLFGVAQQPARLRKQIRPAAGVALEQPVALVEGRIFLEGGRHIVPHRGQRSIARRGRPQGLLLVALARHQIRFAQAREKAGEGLEAVLLRREVVHRHARLVRAARPILLQRFDQPPELLEHEGIGHVAAELELGLRGQPSRRSRMARDELQFALARTGLAPRQIIGHSGRLAVLIRPEKSHVQAVARIHEIIRIAAEGRRRRFRREHEADVGVLAVPVEMIEAAGVQHHHVAALAGVLRVASLLDPGHRRLALLVRLGRGRSLDRRLHLGRHVLDGQQHVDLEIRTSALVLLRRSPEAVLHEVRLRRGELLDAVARHVVVGEDQALRRNERPRAAVVETHRTQAQALEKSIGHLEAIALLDTLLGKLVHQPNAVVAPSALGGDQERDANPSSSICHNHSLCGA